MVWPIRFLMNRQRAFEQRTGCLVFTHIPVESSKVLQTQRDRLVLSPKSSLGDCECPLKQGPGSRVLLHFLQQECQIGQAAHKVRVIRLKLRFFNLQCPL